MNDAFRVGSLERLGYLTRNRQRFGEWKQTVLDPPRQRDAFDQFEHQRLPAVRLLEPVDRCNVGMIERGENLSLAPESRQSVRIEFEGAREHLERHVAIQFAVT